MRSCKKRYKARSMAHIAFDTTSAELTCFGTFAIGRHDSHIKGLKLTVPTVLSHVVLIYIRVYFSGTFNLPAKTTAKSPIGKYFVVD